MQVTRYLGYSSLTDFFPTMDIKPNSACDNSLCRNLQQKFQEKYNAPEAIAAREEAHTKELEDSQQAVTHEDNEWKIEVMPDQDVQESEESNAKQESNVLAPGLQFELPVSHSSDFKDISIHYFSQ